VDKVNLQTRTMSLLYEGEDDAHDPPPPRGSDISFDEKGLVWLEEAKKNGQKKTTRLFTPIPRPPLNAVALGSTCVSIAEETSDTTTSSPDFAVVKGVVNKMIQIQFIVSVHANGDLTMESDTEDVPYSDSNISWYLKK
jgi:hypothetical protein